MGNDSVHDSSDLWIVFSVLKFTSAVLFVILSSSEEQMQLVYIRYTDQSI